MINKKYSHFALYFKPNKIQVFLIKKSYGRLYSLKLKNRKLILKSHWVYLLKFRDLVDLNSLLEI